MTSKASRCPDTVFGEHGPANHAGVCPWCGVKYTKAKHPRTTRGQATDLEQAYWEVYGQHGGQME